MTELREAVARAMVEPLGYPDNLDWERVYIGDITEDGSLADLCRDLADAAIRTVLERLREPSESAVQAGDEVMYGRYGCSFEVRPIWQAMLDAAARENGVG